MILILGDQLRDMADRLIETGFSARLANEKDVFDAISVGIGCVCLIDPLTKGKDVFPFLERLKQQDEKRLVLPTLLVEDLSDDNIKAGLDLGIKDFLPKSSQPDIFKVLVQAKLEKWEYDVTLQRRNRELEAFNRVLKGTMKELAVTTRQLKQVNEENERINHELEIRIRERTKTLQETVTKLIRTADELQKSKNELEEAQDKIVSSERLAAIGELSAAIAHELRNPLGAMRNAHYFIKSKLTKMQETSSNERLMKFLEMLGTEITRSDRIINDLLDFARKRKPEMTATKLSEVLELTLASLGAPVGVTVEKQYPEDEEKVPMDMNQMRLVTTNIIQNAFQAMEKDGGKMRVILNKSYDGMELHLQDTGPGMDEEQQKKIFEPLFSTKVYGTGLGLAVVKKILDAHDAKLTVTSKPGEGTEFLIKMNFAEESQDS